MSPHQSLPSCEFNSDQLRLRVDLTIPAEVSAIDPVVESILDIVREVGESIEEDAVDLALREALANAIVHGCKKDPHKMVQLCVAVDAEKGILIVVRDPGEGFDPSHIASPTVGLNVYSSHGRGIFLINQLMDEVHFEQGGTEIHMRKKPAS